MTTAAALNKEKITLARCECADLALRKEHSLPRNSASRAKTPCARTHSPRLCVNFLNRQAKSERWKGKGGPLSVVVRALSSFSLPLIDLQRAQNLLPPSEFCCWK
jgi:hypothetical protein